jgi:ABC-type phosphate transport system substrate-binding protein
MFHNRAALLAFLFAGFAPMAPSLLRAADDGPPPASLSAHQLKSEIKRLQEEIEKLRQSPQAPTSWKEMRKIEAKLDEMRQARWTEEERLARLSSSEDAALWGAKIETLESRLRDLETEDYKLTRDAGRRLYQARHTDLAKLPRTETPKLHQLGLDVLSDPRMDGSTSTQPLAVLIACRYFDVPYAWVGREQALPKHGWDGDLAEFFRKPEPELRLLEFTLQARAESLAHQRLAVIINRLLATNASTHEAYVNLIEGQSEIGLLARPPSPDEVELARARGIELETLPCALDAFVFLVNDENPVRNLTTFQIRDIYSGKIKDWKGVGGRSGPITAYQREANSGSQELMRQLVMKDLPLEEPKGRYQAPPQLIKSLMSGVYLALTSDKLGLAYSVYYYERFMAGSPHTRTIAVDGVEPDFDAIRQRKYPLVSEVFVVTRKGLDPTVPAVRLRDWLRSPEGQAVVRESGYIPVTTSGR